MDNTAASQRARILEWLRNVGPLSTQQARTELDIMHPGMRVCELRKAGHPVYTRWTTEETQPGRKHRMAKYVLLIDRGSA
jgi:hypothetical protein